MKQGQLVILTAIEREDLPFFKEWRNKEEFKKFFREHRELSSEMQEEWYLRKVLTDPTTMMFSIRRKEDQELLGCCGLCYINWINRHSDLSLYIGFKEAYIDDLGYADESCKLLLDFAFYQLGLNKVWAEIYEFDTKKKALLRQLGFQTDGVLREHYYYEGRYCNSLILSLLREEFITST